MISLNISLKRHCWGSWLIPRDSEQPYWLQRQKQQSQDPNKTSADDRRLFRVPKNQVPARFQPRPICWRMPWPVRSSVDRPMTKPIMARRPFHCSAKEEKPNLASSMRRVRCRGICNRMFRHVAACYASWSKKLSHLIRRPKRAGQPSAMHLFLNSWPVRGRWPMFCILSTTQKPRQWSMQIKKMHGCNGLTHLTTRLNSIVTTSPKRGMPYTRRWSTLMLV